MSSPVAERYSLTMAKVDTEFFTYSFDKSCFSDTHFPSKSKYGGVSHSRNKLSCSLSDVI